METDWASEHLQVIRTLMERAAVYRRAQAPIMIYTGLLGSAGGILSGVLGMGTPCAFILYWAGVAVLALGGSFVLVRRQALKEAEPFWSPPTRRVAQAMLPALFAGSVAGLLALPCCGANESLAAWLPALWMLLYGCALTAAGFFMPRGIKLLGWLFVVCGCGILAAAQLGHAVPLACHHWTMGGVFGGLHLAYGGYLYFTERRGNEP
jgi:hypothetical protein